MKQMREGSIRFLVATDVAARASILMTSRTCSIFRFRSPESYIHRTGRTGRAGRHGVAVSLIGPAEVGSFYYLKLLYKIKPEERTLPSEIEIQARREGESLITLRKQLSSEPGPQWRALARRVMDGS
jgi:ATP-dependent RNA helicase DeaD